MAKRKHLERHKVGRLGWLRAAVLGANDGLLSTASIIIGVASAFDLTLRQIVVG
jgi:VIT1/CCC1 family predicted Fe2+/Mn2+ transporter